MCSRKFFGLPVNFPLILPIESSDWVRFEIISGEKEGYRQRMKGERRYENERTPRNSTHVLFHILELEFLGLNSQSRICAQSV